MNPEIWLRGTPLPDATARLVLLPHAGASAGVFHRWFGAAGDGLEIYAARYPGRAERLADHPVESVRQLAGGVVTALSELDSVPTVLLGHSMGGLVAFEMAQIMPVAHLVVSGCAAPHVPRAVPPPDLPDDRLVHWLRDLGGVGDELDDELLDLLLPAFRADFAAVGTYRPSGDVLSCPVDVLWGVGDSGLTGDGQSWQDYTTGTVRVRPFPGAHFFLYDHAGEVLGLARELARRADGAFPRGKTHDHAGRPVRSPVRGRT